MRLAAVAALLALIVTLVSGKSECPFGEIVAK